MGIAISLHLLGTIVWVGGMFFAHMALRPSLEELFAPAQRLPVMSKVLERFFRWVWLAVGLILASGYWMLIVVFGGHTGLHVHLMQGIGLVMVGLFVFLYFAPFPRMQRAVAREAWSDAGARLALIRRIIATNLVLGLLVSTIAVAGRYL